MKAVILYHPESEESSKVEDFCREFNRRTGDSIEKLSVDSREGSRQAELYDIMQYPAIIIFKDDGSFVKHWVGMPLPLINDVEGYLVQR